MEVNDKKFWLRVKEEYNKNDGSVGYICQWSRTFKHIWDKAEYEKVVTLAKDFLDKCPENNPLNFCVGGNILFYKDTIETSSEPFLKIREDFIDWCIAKFD